MTQVPVQQDGCAVGAGGAGIAAYRQQAEVLGQQRLAARRQQVVQPQTGRRRMTRIARDEGDAAQHQAQRKLRNSLRAAVTTALPECGSLLAVPQG